MNKHQSIQKTPPVWFVSVISRFRFFLKKLYYRFTPPNMAVFEKSQGFWLAKALGVACELNLAEIIGDGETEVKDIARQAGADHQALYRLMRALAGECVFKETKPGFFKNTKLSYALREAPGNPKYMILHQLNDTNWTLVNELTNSVRTGKNSAHKIFGTDAFTHLEKSPEKNELYNKAMTATIGLLNNAVVSAYSFKGIDTLADIGGGEGTFLFKLLERNSDLKGILFDLPHVVETAGKLAEEYGVKDRVDIIPGNFFDTDIPVADAYLLKNILHIFDDETCVRLLKKIGRVIPEDGKILILETVIQPDNKPHFGKMFDLEMLLGTENGKERTEKEYEKLFEQAGFKISRIVKTVSPFSVIEGKKN
jgi:ubiquinone/menaquinone biosynthesis C-methylase UbiE